MERCLWTELSRSYTHNPVAPKEIGWRRRAPSRDIAYAHVLGMNLYIVPRGSGSDGPKFGSREVSWMPKWRWQEPSTSSAWGMPTGDGEWPGGQSASSLHAHSSENTAVFMTERTLLLISLGRVFQVACKLTCWHKLVTFVFSDKHCLSGQPPSRTTQSRRPYPLVHHHFRVRV